MRSVSCVYVVIYNTIHGQRHGSTVKQNHTACRCRISLFFIKKINTLLGDPLFHSTHIIQIQSTKIFYLSSSSYCNNNLQTPLLLQGQHLNQSCHPTFAQANILKFSVCPSSCASTAYLKH